MRDFVVDDSRYSHSVGFDATKRDDLVVTVGVFLNRTQEAFLLETLNQELHADGYLPFRTKSRDLSVVHQKIVEVLMDCRGNVGICIHRRSVKLPYAEAVHSAILLDEMTIPTNKSIIIIDGDRSKADLFQHASSGVGAVPPPVVHCTQSEMYYPHLLLADIIAGMVADEIEDTPGTTPNVTPDGPWRLSWIPRPRDNGGVEGIIRPLERRGEYKRTPSSNGTGIPFRNAYRAGFTGGSVTPIRRLREVMVSRLSQADWKQSIARMSLNG